MQKIRSNCARSLWDKIPRKTVIAHNLCSLREYAKSAKHRFCRQDFARTAPHDCLDLPQPSDLIGKLVQSERVLAILREVFARLSRENPSFAPLPDRIDESTTLDDLHVNDSNVAQFAQELRHRLGGIALNVELMYRMQKAFGNTSAGRNQYTTVGEMVRHIQASLHHGVTNPVVVYVDDEEENLFIFRRRYAKRLNLRTYSKPEEALAFIKESPDVVLVLTDESMPGMSGNQLRDLVHTTKPFLKFILITGNPGGDENLMHNSLRHGRFFDFINKPLDFDKKGEEYFATIARVIEGEIP
jgi:CheY-like chemotaxis protein